MKVTIPEIIKLTGFGRSTIRKRLADVVPVEKPKGRNVRGGAVFYESKDALKALYIPGIIAAEKDQETRTELDKELLRVKIEKERIKVAVMNGDLIPAKEVGTQWNRIAATFKRQALAFPDRVAQLLETAPDYAARLKILKAEVDGLLMILSQGKN